MQSPALLHSMRPARRGISEARSPRHQRSRQKRLSRGNLVQIFCLLLFIFSAVGVHAAERRVGAAGAAEGVIPGPRGSSRNGHSCSLRSHTWCSYVSPSGAQGGEAA